MTRWFWVKLATIGVAVAVPWMLTDFWGAGVLVAPFGWLLGRFIELGMKNKDIPVIPEEMRETVNTFPSIFERLAILDVDNEKITIELSVDGGLLGPYIDAAGIYWDDHGPNVFDPKW